MSKANTCPVHRQDAPLASTHGWSSDGDICGHHQIKQAGEIVHDNPNIGARNRSKVWAVQENVTGGPH
jgi:hypothetical protein